MNFIQLINEQASQKVLSGHARTAENYRSAARAFNRFLLTRDVRELAIEDVTPMLAMQFEDYLLHTCRVCRNTSSFYARQLRAVYNTAVRNGECEDLHPFRLVYKSVAPTRKRAANSSDLRLLFGFDLSGNPQLAFARDLFYFSFLGRGIAFVDLARLQSRQVEGNHLVYQRSKTGQLIIVELVDVMRQIIRRWREPASDYLFPILSGTSKQRDYDTALRSYNRRLAKLSHLCHLTAELTSYTARHSWASEAYRLGVPVQTISTCMGHTTESTTRIYLNSLSTQQIDESVHPLLDIYA